MKHFFRVTALILAAALLCGCGAEPAAAGLVAAPKYPEMAPYPDESKFIDPLTGIFDDEGFYQVYDAWREDQRKQADVPQGYADSLSGFFSSSVPAFLSAGTENAVCSPLNVYMALAMLAETAGGTSQQQILSLLNAADIESLRAQAGQIWNAHYCADGASACVLGNSLWLDDAVQYNLETTQLLAEQYYASVFQGDLGSEEVNTLLRSWINEQTQGLLEEQAANLQLDPMTVLALASTIYYRAKWSDEFQVEFNTDSSFHAPSGDRTVTFMNQELTYGPYYWGSDFGAVCLRLEDRSKMWLFLPDEGLTPGNLLESGEAAALALGGWLESENQKSLQVNLSLPKFDVGSDLRLDESLKRLGLTSVFDPESADFSPILPEQQAWLDAVNHAARVKIDETGVEAAAYTVMAMCGAAMPPEDEMDFVLDRPFLFVITSQDDLPLFAGIVNEP